MAAGGLGRLFQAQVTFFGDADQCHRRRDAGNNSIKNLFPSMLPTLP